MHVEACETKPRYRFAIFVAHATTLPVLEHAATLEEATCVADELGIRFGSEHVGILDVAEDRLLRVPLVESLRRR